MDNNSKSWIWVVLGFASIFLAQYIFQTLFILIGSVLVLIGLYYTFKNSFVFQFIMRIKERLFNNNEK